MRNPFSYGHGKHSCGRKTAGHTSSTRKHPSGLSYEDEMAVSSKPKAKKSKKTASASSSRAGAGAGARFVQYLT
jgi:hypothetical protein